MSIRTSLTFVLLIAFIIVAVFGLYFPIGGHMAHESGCPFSPGGTSLCGAPLAHMRNWQAAFSAVFERILACCATIVVLFALVRADIWNDLRYVRYRLRLAVPSRPMRTQELYSSGILNRKEPSLSFA